MTNYLREEILSRGLDKVVNYGRILRVSSKESRRGNLEYDFADSDSLLHYLASSSNPWLLRMSQEELSFSKDTTINNRLYDLLVKGSKNAKLHAMWILHERGAIDLDRINQIEFTDAWVIANLFKIISSAEKRYSEGSISKLFERYSGNQDPIVQNHIASALYILYAIDSKLHQEVLTGLGDISEGPFISAFPSGVKMQDGGKIAAAYNQRIDSNTIYSIHNSRSFSNEDDGGYKLYNAYCSSCHGWGGNGVEGQAPSLIGGSLVNASKAILPLIIMHGLQGPITVDGTKQEYAAVMPAFADSGNLDDAQIAQISNYIYNAFRSSPLSINADIVK